MTDLLNRIALFTIDGRYLARELRNAGMGGNVAALAIDAALHRIEHWARARERRELESRL